ncbi:hypothetical protein [Streptosporangium sp. NPDC051022]|uniref:hypothetical protein n=1 Tax=Streptosporangium sp. NPDC051022 TaxID=3155752 RepID=UPI0034433631
MERPASQDREGPRAKDRGDGDEPKPWCSEGLPAKPPAPRRPRINRVRFALTLLLRPPWRPWTRRRGASWECYEIAQDVLKENRERLDGIVSALLEHETLGEAEAYAAAGLPGGAPHPSPPSGSGAELHSPD